MISKAWHHITAPFCLTLGAALVFCGGEAWAQESEPESLETVRPTRADGPETAPPRSAAVLLDSPNAAREEALTGMLRNSGRRVVQLADGALIQDLDHAPIERDDVLALAEVEGLLENARALRLALRDREALHRLAKAKQQLLALAVVPGTARWLAEVETMHGIMAAQAGDTELAERALRRALILDPVRTVRLGEAPPGVVRLSVRLQRELLDAPTGSFTVQAVGLDSARVFLDDQLLGESPVEVRAKTGRHLLRVEAPGYVSYGWAADVSVGEQGPVEIVLVEHPRRRTARALARRVQEHDFTQVPRLLAPLELDEVWWVQAGDTRPRFLVGHCSRAHCFEPVRLAGIAGWAELGPLRESVFRDPTRLEAVTPRALQASLSADLAWLHAPGPERRREEDSDDLLLWGVVGAGAALVAGIVAAVLVAGSEESEPSLQIDVNPCPIIDGCL